MNELNLFHVEPDPLYVPTFTEWYTLYPRKQGKADARKRWAKMTGPEKVSALIAVHGWRRYAEIEGTTFIPYASTWLNQSRWEDEPPQPERKAAPGMNAVRAGLARSRAQRKELNP